MPYKIQRVWWGEAPVLFMVNRCCVQATIDMLGQMHPVFGCMHFRMLQVRFLPYENKHLRVPHLVDHSTLKNKLMSSPPTIIQLLDSYVNILGMMCWKM
jgi:hypothetical protein